MYHCPREEVRIVSASNWADMIADCRARHRSGETDICSRSISIWLMTVRATSVMTCGGLIVVLEKCLCSAFTSVVLPVDCGPIMKIFFGMEFDMWCDVSWYVLTIVWMTAW